MPSPSNTLLSLPGGAALRGLHLGALRRRRAPTSCTAKQIWVCVESMDMGYSQLLLWLLLVRSRTCLCRLLLLFCSFVEF
uniref:Uncharacterized protein n=1 Tax=Setaria viridis TaxID=4556 RepID=A0A4U6VVW1_SETVI|nr:hypothetical protein SEVIR_3G369000v2 [Setaria viridis]